MGGLAEYCVVPANALAVIPESLPYSESAIIGCAVFTAYGAMKNAADMRAGETVAIIGTGGVGSSCLQMARAFGGRQIIAVDISEGKLENAKKMGATHTVNGSTENVPERIREITGGRGVDIAVEALGKAATFVQAALSVRDGGRAVMVGLAPFGVTAEVDITRLVRRQVRNLGPTSQVLFGVFKSSVLLGTWGIKLQFSLCVSIEFLQSSVLPTVRFDTQRLNPVHMKKWNDLRKFYNIHQIHIIGSYGGRARQDLPTIVGLADMGALEIKSAVSQKRKLEDADEVYKELDRGEITGRAIIELS
jgi:Zn-dependent alcohol dehydrogenase